LKLDCEPVETSTILGISGERRPEAMRAYPYNRGQLHCWKWAVRGARLMREIIVRKSAFAR
jgi:hypothetical protein